MSSVRKTVIRVQLDSESDMECGDLSLHSKRPSSAVPRVKTRLDLKLTNDK